MRDAVWISFDLGVSGDYEGMYRWLDDHAAKECGDSLAYFLYDHPGDLLHDMKGDISNNVDLSAKSRIYVIREVEGKIKGTFIIGHRRNPAWTGYAETGDQGDDTSAQVL